MPLLPTDEQWLATIEGAPHLECKFWMPAGSNEAQARYRAALIWIHARSPAWTADRPEASRWLRLRKLALATDTPLPIAFSPPSPRPPIMRNLANPQPELPDLPPPSVLDESRANCTLARQHVESMPAAYRQQIERAFEQAGEEALAKVRVRLAAPSHLHTAGEQL